MSNVSWDKFNKFGFGSPEGFYGCVDKDGVWFDSSTTFNTAIHWCCMYYGEYHLSERDEIEWMYTTGRKFGLSIIHSDTLEKMYEAGLIR